MTAPLSRTKVCAPPLGGRRAAPRLFEQIDAMRARGRRLVWLAGAPGSGKTTLAASYLEHCGAPALWLRLDAVDADPASLLGHCVAAAERAGLGDGRTLPPLTREHLADVAHYARSAVPRAARRPRCRCSSCSTTSTRSRPRRVRARRRGARR